jgi:hypothetical protein
MAVLPERALSIINEYSRSLTRPDWRQSKPIITTFQLYKHILENQTKLAPLLYKLFLNIYQTQWFTIYALVRSHGTKDIYQQYDISHEALMKIDGVQYALDNYLDVLNMYLK